MWSLFDEQIMSKKRNGIYTRVEHYAGYRVLFYGYKLNSKRQHVFIYNCLLITVTPKSWEVIGFL